MVELVTYLRGEWTSLVSRLFHPTGETVHCFFFFSFGKAKEWQKINERRNGKRRVNGVGISDYGNSCRHNEAVDREWS